ncbi:MAG: hypothetical protein IJD86_01490, partial [Clostridia bacterium]|nr:hypothetical protein [Clostridia bacterium]
MRTNKPLYPPPWWTDCPPKPDFGECLSPGDEIILCFVGYDANGNPLFSLKRPRPKCSQRPDCCPPRHPCYS